MGINLIRSKYPLLLVFFLFFGNKKGRRIYCVRSGLSGIYDRIKVTAQGETLKGFMEMEKVIKGAFCFLSCLLWNYQRSPLHCPLITIRRSAGS